MSNIDSREEVLFWLDTNMKMDIVLSKKTMKQSVLNTQEFLLWVLLNLGINE